jgi:hypothetical protein
MNPSGITEGGNPDHGQRRIRNSRPTDDLKPVTFPTRPGAGLLMMHHQQVDVIEVHILRNRKEANPPTAPPPLPLQGSTPPPRILHSYSHSRNEELGGSIDLEVGEQIIERVLRRFGREDVDLCTAQRQRDFEELLPEQTVDLKVRSGGARSFGKGCQTQYLTLMGRYLMR